MSENKHPYREAYIANTRDHRIPEELLQMAEAQFSPEQVVDELIQYECEKTEEFEELVGMFNMGYQKMIHNMDIEPYEVGADKIHMIDTYALLQHHFEQVGAVDGKLGGFVHDGHMYLRDDLDFVSFLERYSHEFMHLVSKTKKVIEVFVNEQEWGAMYGTRYKTLRSGVHQISERDTGTVQYGAGLNEAITELFALQLRKHTNFPEDVDNETVADLQSNVTTYESHIEILREVLRKYAEVDIEDETVKSEMLRMHIKGDPTFLKRLHKAFRDNDMPEGIKVLFSMNSTLESVREVRAQLGITE